MDTVRLRSDIAARLPARWTDTVTAHGGTVTIDLVHEGDLEDLVRAVRTQRIVNGDRPEMMRLLPPDPTDAEYVFQYHDTEDKGVQVTVAAGKGYHGAHPVLRFMSREFMSAQFRLLSASPG